MVCGTSSLTQLSTTSLLASSRARCAPARCSPFSSSFQSRTVVNSFVAIVSMVTTGVSWS